MKEGDGTSLVVQWRRLCTPSAGDTGSIPGWGTKILYVVGHKKKKKNERKKKNKTHYKMFLYWVIGTWELILLTLF